MARRPLRTVLTGQRSGSTPGVDLTTGVRDIAEGIRGITAVVYDRAYRAQAGRAERQATIDAQALTLRRTEAGILMPPELPHLNGLFGPSIYDQKYAEQALLHYSNQLKLDADARAGALHRHAAEANNPGQFIDQWDQYAKATVDNTAPPIRANVDMMLSQIGQEHYQTLANKKSQSDFEARVAANGLVGQSLIKDISSHGVLGTAGDAQGAYNAFLDWRDKSVAVGVLREADGLLLTETVKTQMTMDAVAREVFKHGPDKEGTLARLDILNSARAGTFVVDVPGKGRKKIGDVLTVEQMASTIGPLSALVNASGRAAEMRKTWVEATAYKMAQSEAMTVLMDQINDPSGSYEETMAMFDQKFREAATSQEKQVWLSATQTFRGYEDYLNGKSENQLILTMESQILSQQFEEILQASGPAIFRHLGLQYDDAEEYLSAAGNLSEKVALLKTFIKAYGAATNLSAGALEVQAKLEDGYKRKEEALNAFRDEMALFMRRDEDPEQLALIDNGDDEAVKAFMAKVDERIENDPNIRHAFDTAMRGVVVDLGTDRHATDAVDNQAYARLKQRYGEDADYDWATMDNTAAIDLIDQMKSYTSVGTSLAEFLNRAITAPTDRVSFVDQERAVDYYDRLTNGAPYMANVVQKVMPPEAFNALHEMHRMANIINIDSTQMQERRDKILAGEKIHTEWKDLSPQEQALVQGQIDEKVRKAETRGGNLFGRPGVGPIDNELDSGQMWPWGFGREGGVSRAATEYVMDAMDPKKIARFDTGGHLLPANVRLPPAYIEELRSMAPLVINGKNYHADDKRVFNEAARLAEQNGWVNSRWSPEAYIAPPQHDAWSLVPLVFAARAARNARMKRWKGDPATKVRHPVEYWHSDAFSQNVIKETIEKKWIPILRLQGNLELGTNLFLRYVGHNDANEPAFLFIRKMADGDESALSAVMGGRELVVPVSFQDQINKAYADKRRLQQIERQDRVNALRQVDFDPSSKLVESPQQEGGGF